MDTHLALTLDELENLRSMSTNGLAQRMDEYDIPLPAFVRDTLPAAGQRIELSYADGAYKSSLHPEKIYVSLNDAYKDRAQRDLISFHESIRDSPEPGLKLLPRQNDATIFGAFVRAEESNGSYLLNRGRSDEDRRSSEYLDFLIAYRKWEAEPTLDTAWRFVDLHPVFWHKSPMGVHNPVWNLTNGWEQATFGVLSGHEGPTATIDSGGYGAENADYTERYADFLLEVSAPSMDEVVLVFAERVHEVFGINSTENKGFRELRESILNGILNR